MNIDQSLVREIKKKADQAESRVNHLQEMSLNSDLPDGLDIPSINELRYALNHVLRYLLGEQAGGTDALKHVHRALYDCYETESLFLFSVFSDFETTNADIQMKEVFPNYLACARDFSGLRNFIKNTQKENRQEYYAQLEEWLAKVRPYIDEIRAVKQEILKLRVEKDGKQQEKEEALRISQENLRLAQRTVKIRTTALAIAAIGAIGAAVAAAMAILKS